MANALQTVFADIAEAIRGKTGKTDKIAPANMASEIEGITGGDSGGSGGSDGVTFLQTEMAGYSTIEYYVSKLTNTPYITIPNTAKNIRGWYWFDFEGTDSSGKRIETKSYSKRFNSEEDYTVSDAGDGYKKVKFDTHSLQVSGASMLRKTNSSIAIIYDIPDTHMENGVLTLGQSVVAIGDANAKINSSDRTSTAFAGSSPYYMKELDMRESAITTIKGYFGSQNAELEKIYLPRGLTKINSSFSFNNNGLKEIHFTSQTPPTIGSSSYLSGVPTGCTIYVPTGTLATYKSATNYPSPTTYTYVEE